MTMKLHDALKRADKVVLYLGITSGELESFQDRDEWAMAEGVAPEYDLYFDTAWGSRFFVRSSEEVTLVEGRATVTMSTAPDGDTLPGVLEFFTQAHLAEVRLATAEVSMNHPSGWYHTPDKRPTPANVVNACRWLAENMHSGMAVQKEHAIAALCAAADYLQAGAPNPTDTEILVAQHTALMGRAKVHREHLMDSIPGYRELVQGYHRAREAALDAAPAGGELKRKLGVVHDAQARIADLLEAAEPVLVKQIELLDALTRDL